MGSMRGTQQCWMLNQKSRNSVDVRKPEADFLSKVVFLEVRLEGGWVNECYIQYVIGEKDARTL